MCVAVFFAAGTVAAVAQSAQAARSTQSAGSDFANVLLPQPASLTTGSGNLQLTSTFAMTVEKFHSERLDRAISRAMDQLGGKTGLAFAATSQARDSGPMLVIRVQREGDAVQTLDEDESYKLAVASTGASLDAPTVAGAMHGLQTLLQLVQASGAGYMLPAVTIQDEPRFRWRGLMIDCGRHFEPVRVIQRTLDGMAAVKMNVFHWHLTEDQGFRIQSKRFPALTAKGSDGLFYTQDQAREIVAYARDRGIRVVPEFEMPGHSTAWQVAYPELSSGKPPDQIRREFGVSNYALDPTREETYRFIASFLAEMADVFPDQYVHIGGDETPAPDWKASPRIAEFMRQHGLKDSDALQAYFNQRVLKILTGLHKRMIGWDEILNPALPKNVIIQSWRGEKSLVNGAKQGYQGVLSAPYYLDGMHSAAQHYLADPLPAGSDLTAEQQRLILGGEVCMWSEHINEQTIDSRIWPRTAAMAERFWSPQQVRDVGDMYRRMEPTSVELESLGLRHLSQQDVGLRQLIGGEDIGALRIFASVLEPDSFGERYRQQKTSQTTQLDLFVDAARPDPPSGRELQQLVSDFLKSPGTDSADREKLLHRFSRFSAAVPKVQNQIRLSPRLRNMQARADQFARLAQAGAEAVTYLSAGTKAAGGWKSANEALLTSARKPNGIVRFTILDALSQLFAAVRD